MIGGGLPVGAYGGREEVMARSRRTGPSTRRGRSRGTRWRWPPVSPCSSWSRSPASREGIERRTEELCGELREELRAASVPRQVNQIGSMWTCFFARGEVFDYPTAKKADVARFGRVHRALLERGVYLPPSQFESAFLSSEHGPAEIAETAKAFREALRAT